MTQTVFGMISLESLPPAVGGPRRRIIFLEDDPKPTALRALEREVASSRLEDIEITAGHLIDTLHSLDQDFFMEVVAVPKLKK